MGEPMKLAALAALALAAAAAAAPAPDRPVRVGLAGDDLDACLSDGEVTGLNPRGDNFLAVRAAPDAGARLLHRLGPRHRVHVCDEAAGGAWLGIVYSPPGEPDRDCNVGSPVESPRRYRGPCASGWVAARYVTIVAG
jgi:hypothetical protein